MGQAISSGDLGQTNGPQLWPFRWERRRAGVILRTDELVCRRRLVGAAPAARHICWAQFLPLVHLQITFQANKRRREGAGPLLWEDRQEMEPQLRLHVCVFVL